MVGKQLRSTATAADADANAIDDASYYTEYRVCVAVCKTSYHGKSQPVRLL